MYSVGGTVTPFTISDVYSVYIDSGSLPSLVGGTHYRIHDLTLIGGTIKYHFYMDQYRILIEL